MKKLGIDVAGQHQGKIDWKKVKAAGVEFAILKAAGSNAGFYVAEGFEEYYKGAKAAGMPVGAYYYVGKDCKSKADGIADAKRFIAVLQGKQFEYPVYIDFEDPDTSNKSGNTDACIGFCDTMQQAGYYCGIYSSSLSGFRDRLISSKLSKYDKWVADYRDRPAPEVSFEYGIWQYTDKLYISGVGHIWTKVDGNYCYKDYPSIIKAAGLNGFKKTTASTEPTTKPTTGTTTTKPATTVTPVQTTKIVKGAKLTLKNCALYVSASAKSKSTTVSGTYYVWGTEKVNNRVRITNSKANVGKDGKVTGWIASSFATTKIETATNNSTTNTKGKKVVLKSIPLYATSTSTAVIKRLTGVYYLYDGVAVNGRYRITTDKNYCGKSPVGAYVTGWIKL